MELEDRIHELVSEYKGSIKYHNTNRGYDLVTAKLIDEGFDQKQVDDAIDEYGNKHWLRFG